MTGRAITLHQPWATLCVLPIVTERFRENHRVAGGAVSCGYCNRTFTFNFMRDQGPHRCGCRGATAARSAWARPWKTIETRSWAAPDWLVGQRIAIHAAARPPHRLSKDPSTLPSGMCLSLQRRGGDRDLMLDGLLGHRAVPLPRGAIVGTAILKACVPMVGYRDAMNNVGRQVNFGEGWVHPIEGVTGNERHTGIIHGARLKIDDSPHQRRDVDGEVRTDARLELQGVDGPGVCQDVSDQAPFGDFQPGRFAWVLDKPIKFETPILCRGYQRVWKLPDDIQWILARGALS